MLTHKIQVYKPVISQPLPSYNGGGYNSRHNLLHEPKKLNKLEYAMYLKVMNHKVGDLVVTMSPVERAQFAEGKLNTLTWSEYRFNIISSIQEMHGECEYTFDGVPKPLYLRPLRYHHANTRYGFWASDTTWVVVDPKNVSQEVRDYHANALNYSSQAS